MADGFALNRYGRGCYRHRGRGNVFNVSG